MEGGKGTDHRFHPFDGAVQDRDEALANLLFAIRDTANWLQSSCCSGYAMQRSAKLKTLLAEYEALA